jgi:hypothetical protein
VLMPSCRTGSSKLQIFRTVTAHLHGCQHTFGLLAFCLGVAPVSMHMLLFWVLLVSFMPWADASVFVLAPHVTASCWLVGQLPAPPAAGRQNKA